MMTVRTPGRRRVVEPVAPWRGDQAPGLPSKLTTSILLLLRPIGHAADTIMDSDPLLAKSAQGVQHRPWSGLTGSAGPLKSVEIRDRWCQPWVSRARHPVHVSERARLIR